MAGDDWNVLLANAERGVLTLADGAARNCATLCGDLVNAIRTFADLVGQWEAKGFGDLISGMKWSERLYRVAEELVRLLYDQHVPYLELMFDTFKAAGVAYQATEEYSAQNFNSLDHNTMVYDLADLTIPSNTSYGGGTTLSHGMGEALTASYIGDPPTTLTDALNTYGDMRPAEYSEDAMDDASFLSHDQLYTLGQYLRDNRVPEHCMNVARDWLDAATRVDELFKQFGLALRKTVDGDADVDGDGDNEPQWAGEGRDAAMVACDNYANNGVQLSNALELMGHNYGYTGEQLRKTMEAMPVVTPDPTGLHGLNTGDLKYQLIDLGYDVDDKFEKDENYIDQYVGFTVGNKTPEFQALWEEHYAEGYQNSDAKIPNLPDLTVVPPEGDDTATDDTTTDDTEYTGGGGGGFGTEDLTTVNDNPANTDTGNTATADSTLEQQPVPDPAVTPQAPEPPLSQVGSDLLQQAMSPVSDMLNQGLNAFGAASGMPPMMGMGKALDGLASNAARALGGGMPGGGGSVPHDPSKLFPRAMPATSGAPGLGSPIKPMAGMPGASSPMAGTPGSPGAAGRPGGQQQGKDEKFHERAAYLSTVENADEIVGDTESVGKAVVGERPTPVGPAHPSTQPTPAPMASGTSDGPAPAAPRLPPRRRVVDPAPQSAPQVGGT